MFTRPVPQSPNPSQASSPMIPRKPAAIPISWRSALRSMYNRPASSTATDSTALSSSVVGSSLYL